MICAQTRFFRSPLLWSFLALLVFSTLRAAFLGLGLALCSLCLNGVSLQGKLGVSVSHLAHDDDWALGQLFLLWSLIFFSRVVYTALLASLLLPTLAFERHFRCIVTVRPSFLLLGYGFNASR